MRGRIGPLAGPGSRPYAGSIMMDLKHLLPAIGLLVLGPGGGSALAGIIGISGATQLVTVPANWHPSAYENSEWVRVFCLECGGILTEPAPGRIPEPGVYPGLSGNTFAALAPTSSPAGTRYDYFIVHLDPVGTGQVVREGSISFSYPILFITDSLDESPIYQPLEGGDWVVLSDDLRTIHYHLTAGPGVDEFAIATATPEPASLFLVAPATIWFLLRRREPGQRERAPLTTGERAA